MRHKVSILRGMGVKNDHDLRERELLQESCHLLALGHGDRLAKCRSHATELSRVSTASSGNANSRNAQIPCSLCTTFPGTT
jgi:hypothetical protein